MKTEAPKSEFASLMRKRFQNFAVECVKLFDQLPNKISRPIIARQLMRSATSSAANYRAACRARSQKEFFSKLSITIEETDERQYWLEIIQNTSGNSGAHMKGLYKECSKLLAIVSKAGKTV